MDVMLGAILVDAAGLEDGGKFGAVASGLYRDMLHERLVHGDKLLRRALFQHALLRSYWGTHSGYLQEARIRTTRYLDGE